MPDVLIWWLEDWRADIFGRSYVIANNTIEPSPDEPGINAAILEGIIPKLPADVITIEQAMAALQNSGPAMNGTMGGM